MAASALLGDQLGGSILLVTFCMLDLCWAGPEKRLVNPRGGCETGQSCG
jgi:hypothetical protein